MERYRINIKKEYETVLVEDDADVELKDKDFLPSTNVVKFENPHQYDGAHSAVKMSTVSKDQPFDVRHLLDIPIGPSLSDILASTAMNLALNAHDCLAHFFHYHYVRNLLQPKTSYLNMLASLRSSVADEQYRYMKKIYCETLQYIQERTEGWEDTLKKSLEDRNVETFNALTEMLMFVLPAKLTDVYLVGLIMSNVQKPLMVVCGLAHAENAKTKLELFYGATGCEIDIRYSPVRVTATSNLYNR